MSPTMPGFGRQAKVEPQLLCRDALATAPLNKEAASLAGYKSIGHMELLQELSKSPLVATMLMAKNLRVVHLSTHRSLSRACELVKGS